MENFINASFDEVCQEITLLADGCWGKVPLLGCALSM